MRKMRGKQFFFLSVDQANQKEVLLPWGLAFYLSVIYTHTHSLYICVHTKAQVLFFCTLVFQIALCQCCSILCTTLNYVSFIYCRALCQCCVSVFLAAVHTGLLFDLSLIVVSRKQIATRGKKKLGHDILHVWLEPCFTL